MGFRLSAEQRKTVRSGIDSGLSYTQVAKLAACKVSTAKSYARRVHQQSPRTLLWDTQRTLAKEGKRLCPRCREIKALDAFRLYDGIAKYSYCLDCCRAGERERQLEPVTRFSRTLSAARNRAAQKSLPFAITALHLRELWEKQEGKCHYTGEALTMEPNLRHTISLDRICPVLGYVPGNVVLCCDIVNKMKWDMDDRELVAWCRKVVLRADEAL